MIKILPGITHIDGSARIHTVENIEENYLFRNLLSELGNDIGCPVN